MDQKYPALLNHLLALYGEDAGLETYARLEKLVEQSSKQLNTISENSGSLSERDAILITYGDQVRQPGILPLHSLADFCEQHLTGVVSGVHILPFYPFSSDDGFSVIDYRQVDPALGSWDQIARLGQSFRLMFDAVINHISAQSTWFQGFLQDDPRYRDYFITVEGNPDLAQVVRPRVLPLLSRFETPSGPKAVWTTFSRDQVDLNYQNPVVLEEIIELLLFYVSKGAEFIRLDAIAYLWKEIGTTCIHLPQTHHIIQLMRAVLDIVAPDVFLITETNVPHADNLAYFGDGTNEAQMVYNFALPPLVLHTLHRGDSSALSRWAAGLSLPSNQVTFFNFLASHDGIGLNPARGILTQAEIDRLVETIVAHGGLVSYKQNSDGTQSPYELNINYFDALSNPLEDEPLQTQALRFTAAHAIMLTLTGVPGIFFHSLFGSRSWFEGVAQTGHHRSINRQKLWRGELEQKLADPTSLPHQVFRRLAHLLAVRTAHPAFHPYGMQSVLEYNQAVFIVQRTSLDGGEKALCVQNITNQSQWVEFDLGKIFGQVPALRDIVSDQIVPTLRSGAIHLDPYQTLWLA